MRVQHFLSGGLSGSTVEEDAGGVAGRAGEQQPLTSLIWSYQAQLQFHGCLEQVGHVL